MNNDDLVNMVKMYFNVSSQDSLDIWTLDDQYRATIKGPTNASNSRPILTGMAIGLNSKLLISEGHKKLPPCPMLLLSNSEGVLQVYYYIDKQLPSPCRASEVIKSIQISQPQQPLISTNTTFGTPSSSSSPFPSFFPSAPTSSNGFSFATGSTTPSNLGQAKDVNNSIPFSLNLQTTNTTPADQISKGFDKFTFSQSTNVTSADQTSKGFGTTNFNQPPSQSTTNFNQPPSQPATNFSQPPSQSTITASKTPLQPTTKSSVDDISKSFNTTNVSQLISTQQTSTTIDNKALLQTIREFESKLEAVKKPVSKLPDTIENLDKDLNDLRKDLDNILKLFQESREKSKKMRNEHIEYMTKIEDAHHKIKFSQKENLYPKLKDRELDPWTQQRLDLIKTKYDELKSQLHVLLQITHTTIHDKSISENGDDNENEDFIPDLEISLDTSETMQRCIHKRLLELSHKVTETDEVLKNLCAKFDSKVSLNNSTFTKQTISSSDRQYHQSDAQILSYLQANHLNIDKIQVSSEPIIDLSTKPEQKVQSTIETTKPLTPITSTIQPITPKQINSPTIESESYKNMLRIVKTSIDLFSGMTSPEQLQGLADTMSSSPFTSTQNSNMTTINKTPTTFKATTNLTKTSSVPTKPSTTTNILQTSVKSVTPTPPAISVTPPTPASQTMSFDTGLKLQPNKTINSTAVDQPKTQTTSTSADNTIRQLLGNENSTPTTITSIPTQSTIFPTTRPQLTTKSSLLGNPPNTSATNLISQPTPIMTVTTSTNTVQSTTPVTFGAPISPATTVTTSVQAVSPVTKPVISTGSPAFGSKPLFSTLGFNLNSTTSPVVPVGSAASPATPPATSTSTLFGSGFGASITTTTTTAATSAPSTNSFGNLTTAVPSPFGSGFGSATTTTTTASSTGPFGSGAATTSTPSAGPFGGGFGSGTTTTSAPSAGPFGGGFGSGTTTTSAPSASPFGSGFGSGGATTTSASGTNIFGGGFGSTPATASAPSTGGFGSTFSTSATTTSPFGSNFGTAATPASGTGSFGSTPSTSTGTTFGGFGSPPTFTAPTSSTASTGFGSTGFGSNSGFSFNSQTPATSTASSTTGGTLFGSNSGTSSSFGSGFGGFGTQSGASGQSTGFTFSGFGGSQPSGTQQPPPFGGSTFGGPAGQTSAFSNTAFGAPSTQSASSASFTSYRK